MKLVYDKALGCMVDKATGKPAKVRRVLPPSFRAPRVQVDLPEYISPLSMKPVHGRRERREEMARYGVRAVDPSEKPDNLHKTKEQAAREKAQLDARRNPFALDEATRSRLLSG